MKGWNKFLLYFSILSVFMIPIIAVAATMGPTYLIRIASSTSFSGTYVLFSLILYKRYVKKGKTKYPIAFPDSNGDVYFPRSTIPRPIHRDFYEHPEYFKKRKKKSRGDQHAPARRET